MPAPRRLTGIEKRRVAAAHAWRCAICKELLPSNYEIDHILPLSEGGADRDTANLQPLCQPCHAKKTDDETIMRLRRLEADKNTDKDTVRQRVLVCTKCGCSVSPYFVHLCK